MPAACRLTSKSLTTGTPGGSAPGLNQRISTFARTMAFLTPRSTDSAGHTGLNAGLLLACILIPVCVLLLAGLGFLWWRKHALYRRNGKHAKVDNGLRTRTKSLRISTMTISSWLPSAPPPAYSPAGDADPFAAHYAPSLPPSPSQPECWKAAWSPEKGAFGEKGVFGEKSEKGVWGEKGALGYAGAGPVTQHADGGIRLATGAPVPRATTSVDLSEIPPAYMRYSQYA
ncbi:hypothetical protein PsYK624_169180 [Phanerochaete sordida]|uniref:Uncharacterized protein n=1 Tax=Phanerochaete sordida TaxID=48140 RepID=A0A9P3GRQ7_9APHY|nr:hypothetical protein PsYK624_169180 [Phanerochaete sordida]